VSRGVRGQATPRARARGELDPAERARRAGRLRRSLEALETRFDASFLPSDPLALVAPLPSRLDREVGGFLAAGLAHGRVLSIQAAIKDLWSRMGERPGVYVRDAPRHGPRRDLDGWRHRWTGAEDLAAVLAALRRLLRRHGSLETAFVAGQGATDEDVGPALARFVREGRAGLPSGAGRGALWFFSSPDAGSACKRLLLWLRWMVRRRGVDLGLWNRVTQARLVLPLDTHLARIARHVGLTDYRSAGWPAARDATRTLRLLDPDDPVRYDFALSRLGILGECRHRRVASLCGRCPLDRLCSL
jgi:uncharacterized protein (TIGR02757 family)